MNKTFKIVYNRARQGLMVANEITSSVQKKGVKTVVAIAAVAVCGATFAETTGIADKTVSFDTSTTIGTDVLSGENNRYSGIAATAKGQTADVTVVDGATLHIEGNFDNISSAERIYLISSQGESKVSIKGDVTGNVKTTDARNVRGIRALGGEISVNGNLNVTVNGGTGEALGLDAWEKAQVTLEGDKTTLNVSSSGTSGKGTYGLDIEEGSTVSFLAKETEISVDNSLGSGTYSRGAYAYQSTTSFTGNTTIKVAGNDKLTEGVHFECDPGNSYETIVNFSGDETTIDATGKGETYAIYASGVPGAISFTGKTATIKAHSSEGVACGVLSQYGAHANFTADTSVVVSTEESGFARGIWVGNYGKYAGNASFKNLTVTAKAPKASAYGIYNEANSTAASSSKGTTDGQFKSETTTLFVSAADKAIGIYASGDLAKVTVGSLEKVEVNSTSGKAFGVQSQNGASVNLGVADSASVITVTSGNSENPSVGIYVGGEDETAEGEKVAKGSVTLNGAMTINAVEALSGGGDLTVNGDLTLNGTVSSFEGTATIAGGTTTLTESTGYFGNATVVVSGGTLVADSITIGSGSLKLSGGTLQTKLTQVFGKEASLEDTNFSTVDNITLTSGTLVLTDSGTYTSDSLTALKTATGNVALSLVNATLKSGTTTLVDNVIQETANAKVDVSDSATSVTIGTSSSSTGAATVTLTKAADVTVQGSSAVTLVGTTEGGDLVVNANKVTVDNGATLNLGSVNSTEATSGSLPAVTLKDNAKLNVENTTASTTALTGDTGVKISIGSSEAAGSLHADTVKLNSSIIFIDPAWSGTDEIADASFMSVGSVGDDDLDGTIVAGRNSALALGADKATAVAGYNALTKNNSGLTWTESGESAITAALYIGQSIALTDSTKILVDGSLPTLADAERVIGSYSASVTINAHGLLMIDQSAIGSSTVFTGGTLTLANGSYIGLVNATGENLTLTATDSTTGDSDNVTVVTDNPFVTAELSSNTIISTVNATTGLQALASTGLQAMTRRADSILAQTIADRTSVDQELAAGANLWVDVAGETYEADKLDNNASFKADMGYGAFGAEFGIGDTATAGAAIQYGKGSLRSSVYSIKNSIDSYGATIYGTMKFGESKVVADIAYVKNTNDITSSRTALNQKPDTQMYSIGVRGQHRFTAGNFQIVPSVGVRVSRLETDSMAIGSVKVKKQKQNIVQVPIALRINGVTQNAAGWAISPSFKVAYVPTFGDKEITALGADQTVIDTSPVQADFGIRAQKGNLMLNANFMAGTGNDGASSIGGKVGLKYVF